MEREIRIRITKKALRNGKIFHEYYTLRELYKDVFWEGDTYKILGISEFTGREDAEIDGIEVYENDIIKNCDTGDLQVVYWNENKAAWYCRYIYDKTRIVSLADSLGNLNKVFGSIYEK